MYPVTTFAYQTPTYYPILTIKSLSSISKYKNESSIVMKLYQTQLYPHCKICCKMAIFYASFYLFIYFVSKERYYCLTILITLLSIEYSIDCFYIKYGQLKFLYHISFCNEIFMKVIPF